ncbi:MAG TPA: alpha/beta hydrolase [Candidatus Binatia bacterium]|jgi:microsomal epoxide hydrolase
MIASCGAGQINRRSFQTSDSVTLSFLETGSDLTRDKYPTIALVPGWLMPGTIWQEQLQAFGRHYHTLAIDPRGQGESQVPSTGYTAERRATDLHEFLAPRSKVLLIGWSLGAIEALQYVHMFGTARLSGLVLVDSSVGEEPAPRPGGNFKARLREDRDKALSEFVRAIFAKPPGEKALAELVSGAKRMPLDDSLALLDYPFERSHWRAIARKFDKPLLYIVTPQFEQQAINLKKNHPQTQIEVFKKAGHALFVDEPQRFDALIEKFAKRLR